MCVYAALFETMRYRSEMQGIVYDIQFSGNNGIGLENGPPS